MNKDIRLSGYLELAKWRPQIERALKEAGNQYEYFDIEELVEKGYCSFFENETAFAVVQPKEWPTHRSVHILLSGGSFEGMKELEPMISKIAKQAGASKLTSACRLGFAKRIKANGWKLTQLYVEKEI